VVLVGLSARSGLSRTTDNFAGGADSATGLGSPLAFSLVEPCRVANEVLREEVSDYKL
jgi:hypothetical protein